MPKGLRKLASPRAEEARPVVAPSRRARERSDQSLREEPEEFRDRLLALTAACHPGSRWPAARCGHRSPRGDCRVGGAAGPSTPERRADPKGDRVVVTYDGKFLPYRVW